MTETRRNSHGEILPPRLHDTRSYDERQIEGYLRAGRTMPSQKPGRSKQDYATPPEFLEAVKARLGIRWFSVDLAASAENRVATDFYSQDSLHWSVTWVYQSWAWLNPPFGRINPWARKAYEQSRRGARVAMLVPAGVGANWWRDWVHGKAFVLLLNGRITFVGETMPYPKDCALLLYGPDVAPGYDVWTWSKRAVKTAGTREKDSPPSIQNCDTATDTPVEVQP